MDDFIKENNMQRVLFICKGRPVTYGASYGLLNSCRFLANAIKKMGIEVKVVEVIDNNFIDKEVHDYNPTHVFIEALWVVPEKFEVLIPLHPRVQWYVRLHSNTPFLANEGIAMEWLKKYDFIRTKFPQFHIAANSLDMINEMYQGLGIVSEYAPNIYDPHPGDLGYAHQTPIDKNPDILDIGCFGAIRPLKNQLIQAMAAISFADDIGMELNFHINHSRVETNGENVYRNLFGLFEGSKHKLVSHEWVGHKHFMHLVRKMDYGLQVSFSETFNIVAADFVHLKVPVVGSPEIEWMNFLYKADPTSIDSIVNHLWIARIGKPFNLHYLNNLGLTIHNFGASEAWKDLLNLCWWW